MYKVYNNTVPEQINDLFTKSESTHHYRTRYASSNNFLVNFTITEKGRRAISVTGAKVWNELPRPIKEDQSLESFNPIRSRLFYRLKVQEGVFRDPPKISGTIEVSPMKLCTVIVLLKVYQNT